MNKCILLVVSCLVLRISAWSLPFYPVQRAPLRIYRHATLPHRQIPVEPLEPEHPQQAKQQRPKRGHDDYDDDNRGTSGVTGPVHTFVKTDKNANYKWGVRHHVGDKFAS